MQTQVLQVVAASAPAAADGRCEPVRACNKYLEGMGLIATYHETLEDGTQGIWSVEIRAGDMSARAIARGKKEAKRQACRELVRLFGVEEASAVST